VARWQDGKISALPPILPRIYLYVIDIACKPLMWQGGKVKKEIYKPDKNIELKASCKQAYITNKKE
jgi:hypothetical protein